MTKPAADNESFSNLMFPLKGIDLSQAFGMQQPGTTPVGLNVRAYEPTSQRARGGQRPGLLKYIPSQVNGSNLIQELNSVVGSGFNAPGTSGSILVVQTHQTVGGSLANTQSSTFGSAVVSGNAVIAIIRSVDVSSGNGALPTSVTDGAGNVYTLAVNMSSMGSGNPVGGGNTGTYIALYYSSGVIGGTLTVTAHFGSSVAASMDVIEVSGLSALPLDQTSSNGDGGVTHTTANAGAITTTAAQEIVFTAVQSIMGINESQSVTSIGAPWSDLTNTSPSSRPGDDEYQTVSILQTNLTPTWSTFSATVQGYSAIQASFFAGPGTASTSQSGRIVTLVGVSLGVVKAFPAGGTNWVAVANTTGYTLNTSGVVRSASNNQKLWFADGKNWLYYDPATNSMQNWLASQGSLPVDEANNAPRLIGTWRGRTVLSGLLKDGQNWFMSAVGDPTNWNYFPIPPGLPTAAVAGNNSTLGVVGDIVTTLIPYSDDILIFGADSSIWMMNGDPAAGGQIDRVSDVIGMAWGIPWCKGPDGTLYFVSNKMGIYTLVPGQTPVRMSQQIEQLLYAVNTGLTNIRLVWDNFFQGLHVFVTFLASAQSTTHFFWEQRTGAWWEEQFANNNHNPIASTTFDGNVAGDRRTLFGSWDGYVRSSDVTALTDDGTAINSEILIGPLLTADMDDLMLKDLQAILGEQSGDVTYNVYVGNTAELALSAGAIATGTWGAGRSFNTPIRRSGHAVWVGITASNSWSFETIRARVVTLGKPRRRSGYNP